MKYNELVLQKRKNSRRVGRGIAAGQGKTAGRGTKGQKSRAGSRRRPGFEGGQNPLMQRLPKLPGFRSIRPKADVIYTGQLDETKVTTIDNFTLYNAGLISSPYTKVKVLSKGEVKKKLNVKLQSASESAVAQIQKAGGSFTLTQRVARTKKEKTAK